MQRFCPFANTFYFAAGRVEFLLPKMFPWPWLYTVTGSSELITMLNKYGNTVSTSQLQKSEVVVGELSQVKGAEHIPSNIVNHVPVMFVFDYY